MRPEPDLVFPPFRLDLAQPQLWRGKERVPLRPKAFAVLRCLAAHAPRLVPRRKDGASMPRRRATHHACAFAGLWPFVSNILHEKESFSLLHSLASFSTVQTFLNCH
jgi:hypothetical protein